MAVEQMAARAAAADCRRLLLWLGMGRPELLLAAPVSPQAALHKKSLQTSHAAESEPTYTWD